MKIEGVEDVARAESALRDFADDTLTSLEIRIADRVCRAAADLGGVWRELSRQGRIESFDIEAGLQGVDGLEVLRALRGACQLRELFLDVPIRRGLEDALDAFPRLDMLSVGMADDLSMGCVARSKSVRFLIVWAAYMDDYIAEVIEGMPALEVLSLRCGYVSRDLTPDGLTRLCLNCKPLKEVRFEVGDTGHAERLTRALRGFRRPDGSKVDVYCC